MTTENILDAIRNTAHAYEANPEAQLVVEVLRGIVARAQRYEAIETVEAHDKKLEEAMKNRAL